MIVKLRASIDAEAWFQELLESADLTCLGPSETSEYEVLNVSVDLDGDGYSLIVEVERQEGANASRSSIAERLLAALDDADHVTATEE